MLPHPDADDVRLWLARDFGVEAAPLTVAEGGADAAALTWRATSLDPAVPDLAVKWSRRDIRPGLELAATLAHSGLRVPRPLAATDGRRWSERGGGLLAAVPWVHGEEAVVAPFGAGGWQGLGRLLRLVHDTPFDGWAATGRRSIRRSDEDLASAVATLDAGVAARCLTLLERTAPALARESGAPHVTCHGDPHLGNVLLSPEGEVWLVDWDECVQAPREADLVLVLLGVLPTWPIGEADKAAFLEGYGRDIEFDDELLLAFGAIRAVEDVLGTARIIADEERTVGERAAAEQTLAGILSPDGLVGLVEARLGL
ncbi:phosphotransferase enzyme family protein [Herbiconiux sp. SYSU D00978]|uniref:phosphotransferase enzyme family protein n=1 Tax=Herbiconiux sp. SYSU D00978 TaxID=2812562 RepID=UPI001A97483C|nr:phosphotransferase [Herbiconiux sp. SYSU D00978]